MEIVIMELRDSTFTLEDVYNLIRDVYKERENNGIFFSVSKWSFEEFEDSLTKDNSQVIIAFDSDTDDMLGCATFFIRQNKKGRKFANFRHAVVSPFAQRKGVGRKLNDARFEIAKREDCEYVQCSTAVNAKSSVEWHLKYGYKIVALRSFNSNYYSYIFRYQLKPSFVWNNDLFVKCIYLWSAFKTKLKYKENGAVRAPFNIIK